MKEVLKIENLFTIDHLKAIQGNRIVKTVELTKMKRSLVPCFFKACNNEIKLHREIIEICEKNIINLNETKDKIKSND